MKDCFDMETAAILDLKWSYELLNQRPMFAQASADGAVHLYALTVSGLRFPCH